MGKFPALCRILLDESLIHPADVVEPEEALWADLRLAHTEEYLTHLAEGSLTRQAERKLGVPWSPEMLRRSRLAVQGSINAAKMALEDGIAANLAGGTHHAFPDHGEGYCVLNDMGISLRLLQQEGLIARALIIDLDVHQGNGTAAIFTGDERVTTFSMHGERNYPLLKVPSTCDVGLPDGTGDREYLNILAEHLPRIFALSHPDLVIYLAGVDPIKGDRFGRLSLTRQGLHRRDRMVLETARQADKPIVLVLSGGYSKSAEETADLHAITHREAREIFRS
jgi:acetoin utilization deacetylase AcuC-like enzyme